MANKLAEVFVEVGAQTRPFDDAIGGIRSRLGGMLGTRLNIPGGGLMAMLGVAGAGVGIASFFKAAIGGASDLNEQLSKAGFVFGGSVSTVTDAADEMAKKFGISKVQFIDSATSIGLIGKASGLTQEAAAGMGAQFGRLAADVSSFYNVPVEDALMAIRSGLVGESEPMRRFGVLLNENAVKAEAYSLGIARVGAVLTDQQKVQARASLIAKGLSDAQGDLERTSGAYANQTRNLQGQLANMAAEIGATMLPAFQDLVGLVSQVTMDVAESFRSNTGSVAGFVEYFRGAIDTAGFVYRNFGDVVELVRINVAEGLVNLGETFTWLGDTAGAFLDWFGKNWSNVFVDSFAVVTTLLGNLGQNFMDFGKSVYEWITGGFTDFSFTPTGLTKGMPAPTTEAFVAPERHLTSMDAEREAVNARIAAREQERADAAQGGAAAEKKKAEAAAEGLPGKAAKEKAAEIVSVSSIADSLAKAALGQKDPLLKEAQAQTTKLGEIAENTAKGGVAHFAT